MIKLMALMPKRADVSREDFQRYYESNHAPLALGHIEQLKFRKYVRNHIIGPAAGQSGFDCIAEFWYRTAEEAAGAGEFVASGGGEALREDERRFLDQPRIRAFAVKEYLLAGPPREVDGTRVNKTCLLLSVAGALDAEALVLGLRNALEGARARWVLDIPQNPPALPFDGLLTGWCPEAPAGLIRRLSGFIEGSELLRVEALETPPRELYTAA